MWDVFSFNLSSGLSSSTKILYIILPIVAASCLFLVSVFLNVFISLFVVIFGGVVLVIAAFLYSLSSKSKVDLFYQRFGHSKGVIEYSMRVRFLITSVYAFIVAMSIRPYFEAFKPLPDYLNTIIQSQIFGALLVSFGFTAFYAAIMIGFRLYSLRVDSRFNYYYTIGYLKLASTQKDRMRKSQFFRSALHSYNSLLRRSIGFEIRDIERLYLPFLMRSEYYRNQILDDLLESLRESPSEIQDLKAAGLLCRELSPERLEDVLQPSTSFSEKSNLRMIVVIFIPIAIALTSLIIQLYQLQPGH